MTNELKFVKSLPRTRAAKGPFTHSLPFPCRAHAVPLKERAVLCCGLEKNGMVGAWHGPGTASVNQTRPHCVNQKGETHSKPLAARHGRGTACYV